MSGQAIDRLCLGGKIVDGLPLSMGEGTSQDPQCVPETVDSTKSYMYRHSSCAYIVTMEFNL